MPPESAILYGFISPSFPSPARPHVRTTHKNGNKCALAC